MTHEVIPTEEYKLSSVIPPPTCLYESGPMKMNHYQAFRYACKSRVTYSDWIRLYQGLRGFDLCSRVASDARKKKSLHHLTRRPQEFHRSPTLRELTRPVPLLQPLGGEYQLVSPS